MRRSLLVAVGGVLGASARWAASEALPRTGAAFPWATLTVNLIGCLLIGVAARHLVRGSDRWLALVVGVLGGLTTFSTFAAETRELVDADRPALALLYVAASVVGGAAATEIARETKVER